MQIGAIVSLAFTCANCQSRTFYIRASGSPLILLAECSECGAVGELLPPITARELARNALDEHQASKSEATV